MRTLRLRRVAAAIRLIAQAWIGLFAFDLLRVAGFARLCAWLHRCRPAPEPSARVDEVVWAVEEACVWYVKRAACLQRSAVTTWLLRRHGIAAEMVVGCRPLPFESHAWVEVDGLVVNDLPQYQRAFTVLSRV